MDELLSEWLRASRDLGFTLIIADRISGVHGWKGKHRPIAYHRNRSTIIIEFDESEQLTILVPVDIDMDSNGVLIIGGASEVRFTWHSHDDIRDTDLPAKEVFQNFGGMLSFSRTGDPFNTSCCIMFDGGQLVILKPIKK